MVQTLLTWSLKGQQYSSSKIEKVPNHITLGMNSFALSKHCISGCHSLSKQTQIDVNPTSQSRLVSVSKLNSFASVCMCLQFAVSIRFQLKLNDSFECKSID